MAEPLFRESLALAIAVHGRRSTAALSAMEWGSRELVKPKPPAPIRPLRRDKWPGLPRRREIGDPRPVKIRLVLAAAVLLAACGGGDGESTSGLDGSLQIGAASQDEREQLCDWIIETQGGTGREVDCGDGVVLVVPDIDGCVDTTHSFDDCAELTVAVVEACVRSMGGDLCIALGTDECAPVRSCLGA